MKPKLVIYGAGDNGGRFACEYRDLGKHGEYDLVGFVDDTKTGSVLEYPVLGKYEDLPALHAKGIENIVVFLLADPVKRLEKCRALADIGFQFPSFVPYMPKEATMGRGVYVHPTASFLGYDFHLGDHVVVGPHVVVEGRTTIGDGTLLAPFTFIGHETRVGEASLFYPRSSCLPQISVGDRCVIWPHVVVHKDLKGGSRRKR